MKDGLLAAHAQLKIGDVQEFDSFSSAVIDEKAFDRISGYIDHANNSPNLSILAGGKYDKRLDRRFVTVIRAYLRNVHILECNGQCKETAGFRTNHGSYLAGTDSPIARFLS